MRKLLNVLIVMLYASFTLNGQNPKVEYEEAVDYCACEIAYAYTKDFASKNPEKDEKKSFDNTIKSRLNDCERQSISVSELQNLLQNNNFKGFSRTIIPNAKNAIALYTEGITKSEAISNILSAFDESFNKINIESSLRSDLKSKFQSFTNSGTNNKEERIDERSISDLQEKINRLEARINDNSSSYKSFFPDWLFFLVIILMSFLFFLSNNFKIKKVNRRVEKRKKEIEDFQNELMSINQQKPRSQTDYRFKKEVENNISNINEAIHNLQNKYSEISPISADQQNISLGSIPQTNQKETQIILFAKTPISENIFNAADVTDNKENKFYKFLIVNDNHAEFEFFNYENSTKRALNGPDSFLYTACEEKEPLNQNAQKIITTKSGIAIKQEDRWVVKEKAQIAYE